MLFKSGFFPPGYRSQWFKNAAWLLLLASLHNHYCVELDWGCRGLLNSSFLADRKILWFICKTSERLVSCWVPILAKDSVHGRRQNISSYGAATTLSAKPVWHRREGTDFVLTLRRAWEKPPSFGTLSCYNIVPRQLLLVDPQKQETLYQYLSLWQVTCHPSSSTAWEGCVDKHGFSWVEGGSVPYIERGFS